jgi:hypothetical protein
MQLARPSPFASREPTAEAVARYSRALIWNGSILIACGVAVAFGSRSYSLGVAIGLAYVSSLEALYSP